LNIFVIVLDIIDYMCASGYNETPFERCRTSALSRGSSRRPDAPASESPAGAAGSGPNAAGWRGGGKKHY
jgi:hypothetical protein